MELWNKFVSMVDFPALILLVLLLLGGYVLYQTQKNPHNNFDFSDMLRDDNGKPSGFRLALFVCLGITSWVIMYIVIKTNTIETWVFIAYAAIWSGAKVAEKAIDAYAASRGAVPPAPVVPKPPTPVPLDPTVLPPGGNHN